jgi:hypothetical protein
MLLVVFLMMLILTGVRWILSEVLTCISFMARDGGYHLVIWISSFEKVLFSSVAHFLIGSLIFGEFSFLSSLYILVISPLSDVCQVFVSKSFKYFLFLLFEMYRHCYYP